LVEAVPPRWIEIARAQPVLWMVAAPIASALLLILLVVALAPPTEAPRPEPTAQAVPASPTAMPSSAAARAEAEPSANLEALEAKPSDALSVEELLLLSAGRAERKRKDVAALSAKLQQQADLARDPAVQAELLRFAADPDTAEAALGALARARSPITTDLLYEIWTSRTVPAATTELARALLYNREVRPSASPALAVALELRAAGSCEAAQAALPRALSDGDRRSLAALSKLTSRQSCGDDKSHDCYACLRPQMKQVNAAIGAAKRRHPPTYPAR
jgi:hypothetical protein